MNAIDLASRGVPGVLRAVTDKSPHTKHGSAKDATTDPARIKRLVVALARRADRGADRRQVRRGRCRSAAPRGPALVRPGQPSDVAHARHALGWSPYPIPAARRHSLQRQQGLAARRHAQARADSSSGGRRTSLEVMHGTVLAPVPDWIVRALEQPKLEPRPIRVDLNKAPAAIVGIIRTIARASEGERNRVALLGRVQARRIGRRAASHLCAVMPWKSSSRPPAVQDFPGVKHCGQHTAHLGCRGEHDD